MRFAMILIAAAVTAAAATEAAAQGQGACFYLAPNFQGQPTCVAPGQRLPSLGPYNDRVASVQIPRGLRVTVCEDANFQGACTTLDQSIPNFAAIGAANKISSVAVEAGGAPRPGGPPPQPRGPQFGAQQPPPPPAPQY